MLLTFAFSVLFAILRIYNAPPFIYIYLGLQAMVITLAQMWFGTTPRIASIVSGALLLPVTAVLGAYFGQYGSPRAVTVTVLSYPCFAATGAAVGYLSGTLLAGCFLVNDTFAEWLARRKPQLQGSDDAEIIEAELVVSPTIADSHPQDDSHGSEEKTGESRE